MSEVDKSKKEEIKRKKFKKKKTKIIKNDTKKTPKNEKQKIENQNKPKEDIQKKTTLKDLKKLQYIGNMKISVGSGKKSNINELSKEKEEINEYLEVPKNLLEDIISSTDSASKKFAEVTEELRKRGYLDEN